MTGGVGGLAASIGNVGAGAVLGAASAGVSGGNILKGAILGGLGGAVSDVASGLPGGANQYSNMTSLEALNQPANGLINPSNLTRAAGSAGIAALTGGNPIVAGAGSLASSVVGDAVGDATGNSTAGKIAGSAAGTVTGLVGSYLTKSNPVGTTLPIVTTNPGAPAAPTTPTAPTATSYLNKSSGFGGAFVFNPMTNTLGQ